VGRELDFLLSSVRERLLRESEQQFDDALTCRSMTSAWITSLPLVRSVVNSYSLIVMLTPAIAAGGDPLT
jgi:hypothetical protein